MTFLTVVCHLNFVFSAFLLHLLVLVDGFEEVTDVADETLAFGEVVQRHDLPAVWALRSALFYPLA